MADWQGTEMMTRPTTYLRASRRSRVRRGGFTLVEMLVAVGLVVLMMSLFAEIFTLATGSMSKQKGIAENDQRARTLETLLHNDVRASLVTEKKSLTFVPTDQGSLRPRGMVPFEANEDNGLSALSVDARKGYFYISENDINDDTDDILQFTVDRFDVFYGRAVVLTAANNYAQYIANPNQPDFDDQSAVSDSTGSSPRAEISYFLRNGTLYRRVLLIRTPVTSIPPYETQPQYDPSGSQIDFFDNDTATSPSYTGDFWTDFDYAAFYRTTADGGALFHGTTSLDNTATVTYPLGSDTTGAHPLAIPHFRFGHNQLTGQPREYILANAGAFIGRFTQEETSHTSFNYPHQLSTVGSGNPYDPASVTLTYNSGVVTQFENGSRIGQDAVLSNVHSFDIKVWDEILGRFVDIGHAQSSGGTPGDFNQSRNRHVAAGLRYGPRTTVGNNRIFDTWHPQLDIGGSTAYDPPPFSPMVHYPPTLDGTKKTWAASSTTFVLNDIAFPLNPGYGYHFAYRVVSVGAAATPTTGATEPSWPLVANDTVVDGDITWQAVKNTKPLRAIQITVRFYDVSSGQLRQICVVRPLLE